MWCETTFVSLFPRKPPRGKPAADARKRRLPFFLGDCGKIRGPCNTPVTSRLRLFTRQKVTYGCLGRNAAHLVARPPRTPFWGTFVATFPDQALDIQVRSEARIQFPKADFDFSAQLSECINSPQQFAAELLLCRFR